MNKKNFIQGFIAGNIFMAIIAIPTIYFERESKYEMGRHHGSIETYGEIYKIIEKEFGTAESNQINKRLYSKKASDLVEVNENGIKTIRVK